MSNPNIRIKRSAVPGKRPDNSQMELGELALNTNDGRLFTKKESVGIGTTVTLLNVWTENIGGGVYYNDGSVGIGTTNPVNNLQVLGGIVAGNGSSVTTIQSGFSILRYNDSIPRTFAIVEDNTNLRIGGGAWNAVNIRTAPSNEVRVAITSSGNVGIGTTNPTSRLHVIGDELVSGVVTATAFYGDINANIAVIQDISGTNLNYTGVNTATTISGSTLNYTDGSFSNLNVSGVTTTSILNVGVGGTVITTTLNGSIGIGTTNPQQHVQVGTIGTSTGLVISGLGSIGITTTNPTTFIDITENTPTRNTVQFGSFGIQSFDNVNGFISNNGYWNGNDIIYRRNGHSSLLQFFNGDILFRTAPIGIAGSAAPNPIDTRLSIKNNGNIGINVLNPLLRVHINDFGTSNFVGITSTGFVGIATTNPTSKLQVQGDALVSGVVTATTFNGQINAGVSTISVNSSTDALRITQTGSGNVLLVEDSPNPDFTPFVIRSDGAVGIGTSVPSGGAPLDVRGNSWFSPNTTGEKATVLRLGRFVDGVNAAYDIITDDATGDNLEIRSNRFAGLLALSRGSNIGFHTVFHVTSNHVTGTNLAIGGTLGIAAQTKILLDEAGNSYFNNSGSLLVGSITSTGTANQRLQVTGGTYISGNTGIGSTNPTERLDVVGNVKLSGAIYGPSELIIDPQVVGDNSGAVRIKGDLYVDGTQTIINSTAIELADFNVGIATTVGTNLLLDGAGIGIGATGIRKTITWNNSTSALTSSEDWNLVSGKQYEINGTSVLSSTTLGSGVVNSSLTSVGTLGQLNVSGVVTATTFNGALNGNATTATTATNVVGTANRILYNNGTNTTTTSSNLTYDGNFVSITRAGDIGLSIRSGVVNSNGGISVGRTDSDLILGIAGNSGQYANNAVAGDVIFRAEKSNAKILFNRGGTNATLAIDGSNVLVGSVSSTGTLGQSLQVTGSSYISGDVGIGTTRPTAKLHVLGSGSPNIGEQIAIFNNSANGPRISIVDENALSGAKPPGIRSPSATFGLGLYASAGPLIFYGPGDVAAGRFDPAGNLLIGTASSTGTLGQPLQVTGGGYFSGNIGIGTTLPSGNLHIQSNVPTVTYTDANSTADNKTWIQVANERDFYWQALNDSGAGGGSFFKFIRTGPNIDSFDAIRNGQSWLTINNSTARLGIGTTNPQAALHVYNGNVIVENTAPGVIDGPYIDFRETGFNDRFGIFADFGGIGDDNKLHLTANTSGSVPQTSDAKVTLLPSGNFLIGSVNPTGTLAQRLQVTGGGYFSSSVGIGTTNPANTLDVISSTGTIRAQNSANVQSVLLDPSVNGPRISFGLSGNNSYLEFGAYNTTNNIDSKNRNFRILTTSTPDAFTLLNSSGNIGIGTTVPVSRLHVLGDVSIASTVSIGSSIDIIPYDNLNNGTLSFEGSAGQLFSITNNLTSGSIFSVNDVSGIPSIDVDANGTVQIAAFGGNLGVGTTSPTSKLHVIGDVLVSGVITSTDYNSASDINLKENIKPISDPIDKVMSISGVSFDWRGTGRSSLGVIAQQVEKVLPELVSGEESKTVNYNGLIGLLIEVVKHQQEEINELKRLIK